MNKLVLVLALALTSSSYALTDLEREIQICGPIQRAQVSYLDLLKEVATTSTPEDFPTKFKDITKSIKEAGDVLRSHGCPQADIFENIKSYPNKKLSNSN